MKATTEQRTALSLYASTCLLRSSRRETDGSVTAFLASGQRVRIETNGEARLESAS